jgi:splicing factor 3A subunit 3
MPLVDIESQQREAAEEFDNKWENGEIKGWEESAPKAPANGKESGGIWCSACKYLSSYVATLPHTTFLKVKRITRSRPSTTPT